MHFGLSVNAREAETYFSTELELDLLLKPESVKNPVFGINGMQVESECTRSPRILKRSRK